MLVTLEFTYFTEVWDPRTRSFTPQKTRKLVDRDVRSLSCALSSSSSLGVCSFSSTSPVAHARSSETVRDTVYDLGFGGMVSRDVERMAGKTLDTSWGRMERKHRSSRHPVLLVMPSGRNTIKFVPEDLLEDVPASGAPSGRSSAGAGAFFPQLFSQ